MSSSLSSPSSSISLPSFPSPPSPSPPSSPPPSTIILISSSSPLLSHLRTLLLFFPLLILLFLSMYFFSLSSNLVTHYGSSIQQKFLPLTGRSPIVNFPSSSGLLQKDILFSSLPFNSDNLIYHIIDFIPVVALLLMASALLLSMNIRRLYEFFIIETFLLFLDGIFHLSTVFVDPIGSQLPCNNPHFSDGLLYGNVWVFHRFSTDFCSDCLFSGHTFHTIMALSITVKVVMDEGKEGRKREKRRILERQREKEREREKGDQRQGKEEEKGGKGDASPSCLCLCCQHIASFFSTLFLYYVAILQYPFHPSRYFFTLYSLSLFSIGLLLTLVLCILIAHTHYAVDVFLAILMVGMIGWNDHKIYWADRRWGILYQRREVEEGIMKEEKEKGKENEKERSKEEEKGMRMSPMNQIGEESSEPHSHHLRPPHRSRYDDRNNNPTSLHIRIPSSFSIREEEVDEKGIPNPSSLYSPSSSLHPFHSIPQEKEKEKENQQNPSFLSSLSSLISRKHWNAYLISLCFEKSEFPFYGSSVTILSHSSSSEHGNDNNNRDNNNHNNDNVTCCIPIHWDRIIMELFSHLTVLHSPRSPSNPSNNSPLEFLVDCPSYHISPIRWALDEWIRRNPNDANEERNRDIIFNIMITLTMMELSFVGKTS